jgi:hypothetical protein
MRDIMDTVYSHTMFGSIFHIDIFHLFIGANPPGDHRIADDATLRSVDTLMVH